MIDRTSGSKKAKREGVVRIQDDVQEGRRLLSESELLSGSEPSFLEEASALANPTPEQIEAFHEHLRKNGGGTGGCIQQISTPRLPVMAAEVPLVGAIAQIERYFPCMQSRQCSRVLRCLRCPDTQSCLRSNASA